MYISNKNTIFLMVFMLTHKQAMGKDVCDISVYVLLFCSSKDIGLESEATRAKQHKKKLSLVNDPQVIDDAPIYAQPNKRVKPAKGGTQAKSSNGKSPTGKGKKSRKCWLKTS